MKDIKTIIGLTFKITVGVHIGWRLGQVVTILCDRIEKRILEKTIEKLKASVEKEEPHMEIKK